MTKSILDLNGAQELTKNEQKSVNGGSTSECVPYNGTCPDFYCWNGTECVRTVSPTPPHHE